MPNKKYPLHHSFEEKCLAVRFALEQKDMSVADAAKACRVGRSPLYSWLKRIDYDLANVERLRHGSSGRRRADADDLDSGLAEEIRTLLDNNPSWGPLKIKHHLYRHRQIFVSQRRIYRFLKEEGVIEARRRAPQSPAGSEHSRRFEAPAPMKLIQMDCLRLELSGGKEAYLVTLLDDHSRFILASRLVPNKTMDAVITVFREGIRQWGLMEQVLCDQGSEFVSWFSFTRFEQLLVDLDVELILSAAHSPQTLGKLERYHRTLREALAAQGVFDYASAAQTFMREFVAFYNYERVHEALKGLVPADRFFRMAAALEEQLQRCQQDPAANRQVYVSCRIGDRHVVLCGARPEQLELLIDGKVAPWQTSCENAAEEDVQMEEKISDEPSKGNAP